MSTFEGYFDEPEFADFRADRFSHIKGRAGKSAPRMLLLSHIHVVSFTTNALATLLELYFRTTYKV
jgi:hypothetical protein